MFSHYFIVIAVNLVTVALKFLENPEASYPFTARLMIAALLLFFAAIFQTVFIIMKNTALGLEMRLHRVDFCSLEQQLCCLSVLRFTDS